MRTWPLILVMGCSRPTEPMGNPSTSPSTSSSVTTIAGPKELAWDTPDKWQAAANTSAIRKATYSIPSAEGDTANTQLTVTTAGGTVEANIERWQGQFKYPELKRGNVESHGVKITFIELRGTFMEGMSGAPSEPKAKQVLLGAIAETQPDLTFFKMTGPEKTVDAAKTDFFHLVSTIRPK
jgi:hypothetical protein